MAPYGFFQHLYIFKNNYATVLLTRLQRLHEVIVKVKLHLWLSVHCPMSASKLTYNLFFVLLMVLVVRVFLVCMFFPFFFCYLLDTDNEKLVTWIVICIEMNISRLDITGNSPNEIGQLSSEVLFKRGRTGQSWEYRSVESVPVQFSSAAQPSVQ